MAIWPVTGQDVKSTKWPAVWHFFLKKLWNRRILANSNHRMSIRKCQAILKWFIDLKSSAWFMLGSEYETMFLFFFRSTAGTVLLVNVLKKLNDHSPMFFFKLSNQRIPANPNHRMSIRKSQAILKWFNSAGSQVQLCGYVSLGERNHVLRHLSRLTLHNIVTNISRLMTKTVQQ